MDELAGMYHNPKVDKLFTMSKKKKKKKKSSFPYLFLPHPHPFLNK